MKMRKMLSIVLVMVLLASAVPMAVMPAVAQSSVPSTAEEIEEVARAVLANEILLYLRAEYLGEGIDCLSLEELRESASYYPQYPRQITDSANRTVTIYKPIKRIVTMSTEVFETIRTLKATDKVVGVSKYVVEDEVFYPGFSDYPNIGTPWSIDYEVLLECNPDVVFTYTKWPEPAYLEEKLKRKEDKLIDERRRFETERKKIAQKLKGGNLDRIKTVIEQKNKELEALSTKLSKYITARELCLAIAASSGAMSNLKGLRISTTKAMMKTTDAGTR